MSNVNRDADRQAGLFFNVCIKYRKEDGSIGVQQAGYGMELRNMPDCTGNGAEGKNAGRDALIKWLENKCAANGKYTLTPEDLVNLFEFSVVDMATYNPEEKRNTRKFLLEEE